MTTTPTVAVREAALAAVADPFHKAYYDSNVWFDRTFWMGLPIWKQPLDLWIYQEMIAELRPDVIVESGTWQGASALYLAQMCDLVGNGQVFTIDIAIPQPDLRPQHPRITYLTGSSTGLEIVRTVRAVCHDAAKVLIILDSDHAREHVLAELEAYAPLVTPGSYLIVEDTDLNGHPVRPDWGPGPAEAVDEFLQNHPEFEADRAREKFGMTFHPGGFLRRLDGQRPAWQLPYIPPPSPQISVSLPHGLDNARQARVLYLCDGDDNNQGQWRIARPCLEAARHGFIADWVSFNSVSSVQNWIGGGRYNVLVTPRMTFIDESAHEPWAEARRRDGLVWLYETDDDLFSPECVEREARVFGADRRVMEKQRQGRLRMLADCDGVIVSRPILAEVVRRYTNKPVAIVPNAIDAGWFEARLIGQTRQIAPLTIGWSGASRDAADLRDMAEAWKIIAQEYADVRFVVQGNHHAHSLLSAVPADRLTLLPWTSVDEHPATLLNMDIACCSVADTEWNHCKSPNKWLEATLAGSASVVSRSLYGEYVSHGRDGLMADSVDAWVHALSALITDSTLRANLNHGARETLARDHALSSQWWRWPTAWAALLEESASQSNGSSARQSHANRQQPVPV